MNFLKKTLLEIEKNIREIIHHNDDYNSERNYYYQFLELEATSFISCLLQSFKSFTNRRKFTCNCGIPPFEYSSETSIKGKRRVSHFTDKKIKSILHLSTLSAIKHDAETRTYYERKNRKEIFLCIAISWLELYRNPRFRYSNIV